MQTLFLFGPVLLTLTLTTLVCACQQPAANPSTGSVAPGNSNPYPTVAAIPLPPGYRRQPAANGSFAAWLRSVPLKRSRTVYLYDGTPKRYQGAQFAVLDISVGRTDLQQCADAVMRLRGEYCYAIHDLAAIDFYTEQGLRLNFLEWSRHHPGSAGRASFDAYLTKVFMYCSTRTLEKQLLPKPLDRIAPGDVLVKGGAPGHAMIVMDVAQDAAGHRVYLLAQSYMPAQDIHIVQNLRNVKLSPWYTADTTSGLIETPEWTFTTNPLRSWPAK